MDQSNLNNFNICITKIRNGYKTKLVLHLIAAFCFILAFILIVVSGAWAASSISSINSSDLVEVYSLSGTSLTGVAFIAIGGIIAFANSIYQIFNFSKSGELEAFGPSFNNDYAQLEKITSVKNLSLVSLICGFVFPLASFIVDIMLLSKLKTYTLNYSASNNN